MTTADQIASLAAAGSGVSILATLLGAVYLRARLDSKIEAHEKAINDLEQEVYGGAEERGMQKERVNRIDDLIIETRRVATACLLATSGLERHEAECNRRSADTDRHLEGIHTSMNNLRQELINVARGQAGKFEQVRLNDK